MSYRRRAWSVRHARALHRLYQWVEGALVKLHPLLKKIGYQRVDKPVLAVEKVVKGVLFDSKSCGQCALSFSGMSCPMNCPKSLRNGPCGGVRADGNCEIEPDMPCVWVKAWEGSQRFEGGVANIQTVQPPVDIRLNNSSAWLRAARERAEGRA